ncbi:MAG: hypothetical protein ABI356_13630 [Steroidobacteraceae bacterium]
MNASDLSDDISNRQTGNLGVFWAAAAVRQMTIAAAIFLSERLAAMTAGNFACSSGNQSDVFGARAKAAAVKRSLEPATLKGWVLSGSLLGEALSQGGQAQSGKSAVGADMTQVAPSETTLNK